MFHSVATELHPKSYPCSVNEALPLFKAFNRISYKAIRGREAGPYDPNRDIKLWEDDNAPKGHAAAYSTWTQNEAPAYVHFSLPGWIARSVNLPPDLTHYQPWNPLPSDAVVMSGGVAVSPINPDYLATETEADDLYAALGGIGGVQLWTPDPGPGDIHVQYGEDPRREFQFYWGAAKQVVIVGLLLKQMYINGVGAPGEWNITGAEPRWIPAPPPVLPPTYKVVPMPMRNLYPFEQWDILPVGAPMISRK